MRANARISKGLRCRPPLDDYRRKRDPARTPEPFGAAPARTRAGCFVVQKHAARRLHYDLRLEMDGVLKSWAVPKGPSLRAEEKRLAVHVEDHPVEYADFEGVIPDGNYGAGSVIVWDRGWYGSVKAEDPLEQLARGKLEVELFGVKLRGRWTLARMGGKDKDWLLLKKADGFAGRASRRPSAIPSRCSRASPSRRCATARRAAGRGARARSSAAARRAARWTRRASRFMLATLARARRSPGRAGSSRSSTTACACWPRATASAVALYGRRGQDITGALPGGRRPRCARCRSTRFVLDGEIVALDEARPAVSFQRLQKRMHLTRAARRRARARRGAGERASSSTASRSRATICARCRWSSARRCWR